MTKKGLIPAVCAVLMALVTVSCSLKVEFGKSPVKRVIAAMTLEEKVSLLVSIDAKTLIPGSAGQTYPIPRLGIPSVMLPDGSGGLCISPTSQDDNKKYHCTSFPITTQFAQSWNPQLVEEVSAAIGDEVKRYGAECLLVPALNLHRNQLQGQSFEYYSEDPVVSGKTAAAMVRGVQSNGVGATIKHYALDNQQTARNLYLKGFEIAVRESQPWAVMTTYNKVNGTYAPQSATLIDSILRREWGFEGIVMTDCGDDCDAVATVESGNDLLMNGSANQIKAIIDAVDEDILDEKVIDRNVANVLAFIARSLKMQGYEFQNDPDLTAHAQVSRSSATECMVLLKNNGALPLSSKCKMIALYGACSYDIYSVGTVSGSVNYKHAVGLDEGLKAAGYKLEPSVSTSYSRSVIPQSLVRKPFQYRADAISSDIAIITIGRSCAESAGLTDDGDYTLTEIEQGLIADVCDAFHSKGKKVIVILNIGAPIETASWKSRPDAILLAGLPGQEAGYAITDVLKGAVNPSGKLVDTFVVDSMDMPSTTNCSLNFGYRYYDCHPELVSYPFGFGLSYTTFAYSEPQAKVADGVITLSVKVTNTGKVAGKESVQVYIEAPNGGLNNLKKELKSYGKTALLQPGATEVLEFKLSDYELAGFDMASSSWQTLSGEYKADFAASSQDIRCQAVFTVAESSNYPAYGSLR